MDAAKAMTAFQESVRKAFAFLAAMGFTEVEALPTLVRFQSDRVEVDIYHGRKSYEIGSGVTAFGCRYALSEVIRATDAETAKKYRNVAATTPEQVAIGVEQLSLLMQRYAELALRGDQHFFETLKEQRAVWAQEYALDVLAEHVRPQAAAAFREGDYKTAAELYSRIRSRLTPAEIGKLALAEARRETIHQQK